MKRQRSDAMQEYEAVVARSGSQFFNTYGRMLAMRTADRERWKERALRAENLLKKIASDDFYVVGKKSCMFAGCTAWSISYREYYHVSDDEDDGHIYEDDVETEFFDCIDMKICARCGKIFCNKHMPNEGSHCTWCVDVERFLNNCRKK